MMYDGQITNVPIRLWEKKFPIHWHFEEQSLALLWENHLLRMVIERHCSAIIIPLHLGEADMLNNEVFGN